MAGSVVDNDLDLTKLLPAVRFTKLPSSLLKFPPSPDPTALPPPPNNPSFAHPFTISAEWYNALLDPYVPITVAVVYATTVTFFNSVNARRNWKPWGFSKTTIFKAFVILHNVLLAVYSAWTFLGMLNALILALPNWRDEHGMPGVVDALCRIQGPRGLGSAASFNEESRAWTMTNRAFHLAADGLGPERTDVGRLWNEGLAFYGWIFYLSKFYEVIDTAIILAKGKKSSFLQTYHHAGAMISMWAGIRYMSPPIWMFVFVNSFIHALMYTFYLCSALRIRVPKRLKRILTTMQITQFVVGATYAFAHLFVKYQIPVSVPYLYRVAPKIVSLAAADVSSVASSAIASATADTGAFLKRLALRAAGYEGLAENVGVRSPVLPEGVPPAIPQQYLEQAEERYRDELQWVHCLDTSGQAFAILLNCLYLAPLTWLFARFFIKAYLTQLERRRSSASSDRVNFGKTYEDAKKGVGRKLSEALIEMHATADSSENDGPIVESSESVETLKEKAAVIAEKSSKVAQNLQEKATKAAQSAKKNAGAVGDKAAEIRRDIQQNSASATDDIAEKAKEATEKVEQKSSQAQDASREGGSADSRKEQASTKVTEDKSFADAVKEEPEPDSESKEKSPQNSPNDDGTGAEEVSGSQNNTSEIKKESAEETTTKKEEDKIIDESQAIRDEDVQIESGTNDAQINGSRSQSSSSNIPRPKKLKKKA